MDWRILFNPLAVLGKWKGLVAAVFVVVVLGGVAYWGGVHLDGALDIHINPVPPTLRVVALESVIAWLSVGLLFFVAAKVLGANGGFASHLAAAGLGRFPFIFAAAISSRQLLGKAMLKAVASTDGSVVIRPQDLITPGVIIGALAILALTAWMIVTLLYGFKEASKLSGGKLAAAFVIAIIAAEVASKLILTLVLR
jgi:hypothetical protein